MKAKPVKLIDHQWARVQPQDATHLQLKFPRSNMPEPLHDRYIPVQLSGGRVDIRNWSWNGDTENPTLKPSILTEVPWGENREIHRCHTFVNDGMVQFLNDCSHDLRGQTLDLLEV